MKMRFLFFCLLIGLGGRTLFCGERNLSFAYGFIFQNREGGLSCPGADNNEYRLYHGSVYKVLFKTIRKNTYVYFLNKNMDEQYFYPYPGCFLEENYCNWFDTEYSLPQGRNQWFGLDPLHPAEEFILIIASGRLRELEKKIKKYLLGNKSDSDKNKILLMELESEIKMLQLNASPYIGKVEEAVTTTSSFKAGADEPWMRIINITIPEEEKDLYVYTKIIKLVSE